MFGDIEKFLKKFHLTVKDVSGFTWAGLNAPSDFPAQAQRLPVKDSPGWKRRVKLLKKQEGVCAYCDKKFDENNTPTVDHIIPKSKGGSYRLDNLVLVCSNCNTLKGNLTSYHEAKARAVVFMKFVERLRDKGYLRD